MEAAVISSSDRLAERLAESLQRANVNCIHLDESDGNRITSRLEAFDVIIVATDRPCHAEFTRVGQLVAATNKKVVLVADVIHAESALEAVRKGAFDVLDHQSLDGDEVRNLVDRLHAAQSSQTHRRADAYVIASTGNSDDVSLIAINLAAYLSSHEQPANLIDLRISGHDIAISLRMDVVHNSHDLLARTEIDPPLLQQAMVQHATGMRVLANVCTAHTAQDLSSRFVNRLVDCSKILRCPSVVCTDNGFHLTDPDLFLAFDRIILPTRLDVVSIWRTQTQVDYLSAIGIASSSIVIMGICDQSIPKPTTNDLEQIFGELPVVIVDYDPLVHATSTNIGQPSLVQYPHSKLSTSLRNAFANHVVCDSLVKKVPDFWSRIKLNLATQLSRFNGI